MTSIPNELNITINTSVPGYQKIIYKPSMTIKDISKDDNSVRFNPLIRLNQSLVDKVPENLRKKQFFNSGLFQSLLNYTNLNPEKNLVKATNNGVVDNNIKVTLNTLFPENSVIYIGKNPYVIADVQWSNGDWKIDTKSKPQELDPSKITDPELYQTVVKNEIISGEEQLNTLPSNLVYGPSYVGPLNTASGLKPTGPTGPTGTTGTGPTGTGTTITGTTITGTTTGTTTSTMGTTGTNKYLQISYTPGPGGPTGTTTPLLTAPPTTLLLAGPTAAPPTTPLLAGPTAVPSTVPSTVPYTTPSTTQPQAAGPQAAQPQAAGPTQATQPSATQPSATQSSATQPQPGPSEGSPTNTYEVISETTHSIKKPVVFEKYTVKPTDFKYSRNSTIEIRDFFKSPKFKFLMNEVFKASPPKMKKFIEDLLKKISHKNIKENNENISSEAYNEGVNNVTVESNTGGGDCFFISVADAINYYNFKNQGSRIVYDNIQGTGENSYTQLYLRNIVLEFLNSWEGLPSYIRNVAPNNVERLNGIFKDTLRAYEFNGDIITPEDYLNIANSIYATHDNFFVQPINSVLEVPSRPVSDSEIDSEFHFENSDYYNPFKLITRSNKQDYILSSNYWANEIAIMALSSKLKLNVIVIEKIVNHQGKIFFSTPIYSNFTRQYNTWNRYLFLYYKDGHYELITFKYSIKVPRLKGKNVVGFKDVFEKKTIFDKREIPPIFILFIIFGSFYSCINQPVRNGVFTFHENIMKILYQIISQNIYVKPVYPNNLALITPGIKTFFYHTFIDLFPGSKIPEPINRAQHESENEGEELQLGGYTRYNRPYYRQTLPENLVKKGSDKSKIAYYITIDMELHPGTSITPEDLKNIKCRQKWNAVRKAYSRFIGKPYVIPPVYENKTVKNRENMENNNNSNKTQSKKYTPNHTRNKRDKKNGYKNNTVKKI
jgi:hypothetical protein